MLLGHVLQLQLILHPATLPPTLCPRSPRGSQVVQAPRTKPPLSQSCEDEELCDSVPVSTTSGVQQELCQAGSPAWFCRMSCSSEGSISPR